MLARDLITTKVKLDAYATKTNTPNRNLDKARELLSRLGWAVE